MGEPAAGADQPESVPLDGVVLQRGDRTPVAGVSVALDGGALEAVTAADGTFSFPAIAPGEHVAHLRGAIAGGSGAGVETRLVVTAGRRATVTWYVLRTERFSSTVRGRRLVQEVVEQTLTSDEVKHIAGTQGDTVKAVQNLPGVARPPFNGGLIVVWGSAPEDTRAYVDGVYIPMLFHFSGLRSTVNSELVSALTFLPGGYGVDYGRGLGGAIEVESRRPRASGIHGYAQVDVIDLSALVEGPLAKNLEVAVAARVSWLHLFLPLFLTSDVQASPRYWDYQAKLHWRPTPRDDIDLFFFGSDDQLALVLKEPDPTLTQAFDHHTYHHRGLARFTHRFEGGGVFMVTPSVGYDLPYNLGVAEGSLPFHIENGQLEWNLRTTVRVPLGAGVPARLDAGLDYEGTRFHLDAMQNVAGLLREGDNGGFGGLGGPDPNRAVATDHMTLYTHHVAPFTALVFSLLERRITVTPQLRVEVLQRRGYPGEAREFTRIEALVEPRLSLRAQVHPRVGIKGSLGWYHQPPSSPDLSQVFGNPQLRSASAIHYVLGLDVQVTPALRVEAQGFYKELHDLVVRAAAPGGPPLDNGGTGRVWGGELLVRQELWKNFFGWVSYTVSRSERRDRPGDPWRSFAYDQTHILTVLGSYQLPLGFRLGVRFRYATGNPYTPVVRSYFDANSDGYVPLFGATYSARMPSFNQLDLRVDKEFVFDRWKLVAYLDLQNVYAARSAEAAAFNYSFTQTAYVSGLPFLPVLGVRGEF